MHNLSRSAALLACAMALSGCAASLPPAQPITVACPKMPPAPASVMLTREADFSAKMLTFCCEKLPVQTK